MNGWTILTACMVLVSAPAFGQSGKPEAPKPDWIVDGRTGCRLWDRDPRPNETITWSGACWNGRAEGRGGLNWFKDGRLVFHLDGIMRGGKANGHGVETFASGDVLDGEFRNGNAGGRGTYTFASGDRFVGQFRDGKPNGHGVYTFVNGSRYDGRWRDGKTDGWGVKTFANGNRYAGEWHDDKMNGRGTYHLADGTRYDGEFRGGLPNGHGRVVWPGGASLVGVWVDGCYRDLSKTVTFGVDPATCR